ncbi:uncharacterized protein LOC130654126 [Hydractinia symbiolongicarpus]|uniref:uncharacterized protein LOC130654126 n=1 Tax=Hydractinia symbiolongicarpus TaxID=13093 RepID=UPI00254A0C5B|nr:uncharacterized protein LOC130654126 [Hydractinia symbiolongicarpus]
MVRQFHMNLRKAWKILLKISAFYGLLVVFLIIYWGSFAFESKKVETKRYALSSDETSISEPNRIKVNIASKRRYESKNHRDQKSFRKRYKHSNKDTTFEKLIFNHSKSKKKKLKKTLNSLVTTNLLKTEIPNQSHVFVAKRNFRQSTSNQQQIKKRKPTRSVLYNTLTGDLTDHSYLDVTKKTHVQKSKLKHKKRKLKRKPTRLVQYNTSTRDLTNHSYIDFTKKPHVQKSKLKHKKRKLKRKPTRSVQYNTSTSDLTNHSYNNVTKKPYVQKSKLKHKKVKYKKKPTRSVTYNTSVINLTNQSTDLTNKNHNEKKFVNFNSTVNYTARNKYRVAKKSKFKTTERTTSISDKNWGYPKATADKLSSFESDDYSYFSENYWKNHIKTQLEYVQDVDGLRAKNLEPNKKLVLLWSFLWHDVEWTDIPIEKVNEITEEFQCPVRNCVFTYNKRLFNKSDAVVFHIPDEKDTEFLINLNKYGGRSNEQRWVFFTSESSNSVNTPDLADLDGLFNVTMTYDTRSDIYLPYGKYRGLKRLEKRPAYNTNYAKGKKNAAVWFVSNCGMYQRNALAREIEKYIKVYVGGNCQSDFQNNVFCEKADGNSNVNECSEIISQYKFHLSFESRFCDDYVTEKYWDNAIANGVVPLVLGGANYADPRVAIPGSYIDIQKFKNVKELGEHLQMLTKSDKEYNKYFKWKQKYKLIQRDEWPYSREWLCEMCDKLNNNGFRKQSYNLSEWWGKENRCDGVRSKVSDQMFDTYWAEFRQNYNVSDEDLEYFSNDDGSPQYRMIENVYRSSYSLDNHKTIQYNSVEWID